MNRLSALIFALFNLDRKRPCDEDGPIPGAGTSINFFTCILAKKLGAKRTIARLTNTEFIENGSKFDFSSIGIDEIISPENLAVNEVKLLINNLNECHRSKISFTKTR